MHYYSFLSKAFFHHFMFCIYGNLSKKILPYPLAFIMPNSKTGNRFVLKGGLSEERKGGSWFLSSFYSHLAHSTQLPHSPSQARSTSETTLYSLCNQTKGEPVGCWVVQRCAPSGPGSREGVQRGSFNTSTC